MKTFKLDLEGKTLVARGRRGPRVPSQLDPPRPLSPRGLRVPAIPAQLPDGALPEIDLRPAAPSRRRAADTR